VDPRSVQPEGRNDGSVERYLLDQGLREAVARTPAFAALDGGGFDVLFLPGGHGTMFDFPGDAALARLVERFDGEGRIVAAVCHGPAGLVAARRPDGSPLVAGRRLSAFTDSEERSVGLDAALPFLLESRLRALGARHEAGPDFQPFALRDGNLVTGQNPASAGAVAALVTEALARQAA
jgi:putative intracellular protease/amidase